MRLFIKDDRRRYELEHVARLFCEIETMHSGRKNGDCMLARAAEIGDKTQVCFAARLDGRSYYKREYVESALSTRALAGFIFDALSAHYEVRPAWGTLTGVRPVKLVRMLLDRGLGETEVKRLLTSDYRVEEKKYGLALKTEKLERTIIEKTNDGEFSLYVSIPFCPSRCAYCSFVSQTTASQGALIEPYFELLLRELEYTAKKASNAGLRMKTAYIGGGTPAILTARQTERLCSRIAELFGRGDEFTFEAGRPDVITLEKLAAAKESGVTRICINPQSMNDSVLFHAGRKHGAADTVRAFEYARQAGFYNINSDLIAGLPADTPQSFERSLHELLKLYPESITVHSLSRKRSSDFNERRTCGVACAEMLDIAYSRLTDEGYSPYYLYRQKNTVDNLENVGWAKSGNEGLYNIYIMDETHSVLACGAGATTKLKSGKRIERIFNFKYPAEYIDDFAEIMRRKDRISEFFKG